MSHISKSPRGQDGAPVTIPQLRAWAAEGRKLVMTTAYDSATAQIADASGVDIILVGDSVGNVCLGFETTLPVTMAMMNHHLDAVARTKPRAMLMGDMPYLSYHLGPEDAIRNAGEFIRRGAAAVKLEGGAKRLAVVRALVEAEIPVMGHLGLTPQSFHSMGGYKVQGREGHQAIQILEDALRLQDAGCFSVLLEGIPAELARKVTDSLEVPTIGIGAGPHCSGQVLVLHDLLGLLPGKAPKFVRRYADGFSLMTDALARFASDVREGSFPSAGESYTLPESAIQAIQEWRPPQTRPE